MVLKPLFSHWQSVVLLYVSFLCQLLQNSTALNCFDTIQKNGSYSLLHCRHVILKKGYNVLTACMSKKRFHVQLFSARHVILIKGFKVLTACMSKNGAPVATCTCFLCQACNINKDFSGLSACQFCFEQCPLMVFNLVLKT